MRPCDCLSMQEARDNLNEQGFSHNEYSIHIEPLRVILVNGPGQLIFPMKVFQALAEWYLEDQF